VEDALFFVADFLAGAFLAVDFLAGPEELLFAAVFLAGLDDDREELEELFFAAVFFAGLDEELEELEELFFAGLDEELEELFFAGLDEELEELEELFLAGLDDELFFAAVLRAGLLDFLAVDVDDALLDVPPDDELVDFWVDLRAVFLGADELLDELLDEPRDDPLDDPPDELPDDRPAVLLDDDFDVDLRELDLLAGARFEAVFLADLDRDEPSEREDGERRRDDPLDRLRGRSLSS
jgi:hypothetical protein